MKLSFSIPSKPSSSSKSVKINDAKNDSAPSKHFVTEFDPFKPPTTLEQPSVIPPIQNEWRPLKKMKNLNLPITDPNAEPQSLQFEHDNSAAAGVEPGSDMSYGLNLRQSAKKSSDNDGDGGESDDGDRAPRQRPEAVLLQKFKDDLKRLPDDRGFEEFQDVPVEGFGKALLAGYGWSEGMGIGKNAKEDVKVVQYERRTAKEGLGFVADDPRKKTAAKKNKVENGRDDRGKKGAVAKNIEENGRGDRDFVAGEKKDKVVRIIGGRDAGLKGTIVRRIGEDWVILKIMRKSGEGAEVRIKVDDIAELGSVEEERCLRKLRELRIQQDDDEHGEREKDKGDKGSRSRHRRKHGEFEETKRVDVNGDSRKDGQLGKKQVSWLASHIRVRVISRDFKGGRLYLKKGEVLDVVGPTICDISMDESKEMIVQGVSQDILETALPRRGGPVLVLSGKYKGMYGSLVERDLDREIGLVKDADTHELFNVRLEEIAEYIGDPNFLGH